MYFIKSSKIFCNYVFENSLPIKCSNYVLPYNVKNAKVKLECHKYPTLCRISMSCKLSYIQYEKYLNFTVLIFCKEPSSQTRCFEILNRAMQALFTNLRGDITDDVKCPVLYIGALPA